MMLNQSRSKIANNLCETHFPEPIIFYMDKPLCRKCVPEYIKQQQLLRKRNPKTFNQN